MSKQKRKLTEKEIEFILDFLNEEKCTEYIKIDLKNQLSEIELYPNKINELKTRIEKTYHNSLIQPGSMIGVDSAMSISSDITQATLNSFHFSGVGSFSASNLGVGRLNEILNISKNQKVNSLKIKLLNPCTELSLLKRYCKKTFEEAYIGDGIDMHFLDISYLRHTKLSESDKIFYDMFKIFFNNEFEKYDWSCRLKFKPSFLYDRQISLLTISDIIQSLYEDAFCVFSPDDIGIIDVYIDTSDIIDIDENKNTHINNDNKNYYYVRDIVIGRLMEIKVSGIEGIEMCYYRKDPKTNEWIIDTNGTNFRKILNHPDIDYKHTLSNNIWEIYELLGIEAARAFLISELISISPNIDKKHIYLLADIMTFNKLTAVSRHGIDRNNTGCLTKANFEQSLENMLIAAHRNECDDFRNVSSSIIFGKQSKIGTGIFDLTMNVSTLLKY